MEMEWESILKFQETGRMLMNKKNNTKRILLVVLMTYAAVGIMAGLYLYSNGVFAPKDDSVVYHFEEDNSTGLDIPDVSITSVDSLGDSHAQEEPEIVEAVEEEQAPVEDVKKYYSFVVNTEVQRLMIRETPSLFGKILSKMPKGTPGYVLEYGDEWCLVTDGKTVGYSYTEFLSMTELDPDNLPDDFPEDYR